MPTSENTYSSWVGIVYVFNLIVGTGALTLPAAFATAGWLLSLIALISLGFVSFITVTFIIECIACANATTQWTMIQSHKIDEESEIMISNSDVEETNEHTAIIRNSRSRSKFYTLEQKMGLGHIANLYFNKWGIILFYTSMCTYLYGDLAIYAAVIGKSLSAIICPTNHSVNGSLSVSYVKEFDYSCWQDSFLQRIDMYRICVAGFSLLVCPLAYFNVQKTKHIQICTSIMRWCAFTVMVTIASLRIMQNAEPVTPNVFEINHISALVGASIYSFMCHHSLPELIAPFSNKQYVTRQLALDYILIAMFYLLLTLTGVFAFKDINDLYTLNFQDSTGGSFMRIIGYYLELFPAFTLSTSFPIIAITLQNNIKALFLDLNTIEHYHFLVRKLIFPTVAVIPPVIVALCTHNISNLVKFTGAYAGVCIQFFIPAFLVFTARKKCQNDLGNTYNQYGSRFQSIFWIIFVLCWGITCVIFVTVNFFIY